MRPGCRAAFRGYPVSSISALSSSRPGWQAWAGARLAEAESALAPVDNGVLGAVDDSQREVLYTLLLRRPEVGT